MGVICQISDKSEGKKKELSINGQLCCRFVMQWYLLLFEYLKDYFKEENK